MADQEYIRKQAEILAAKTTLLQEEVTAALIELTQGLTAVEVIEALDHLEIDQIMAAKAAGIMGSFDAGIAAVLESKELFAPITEKTLQALLNSADDLVAGELATMGRALKSEIVTGIISNLTPKEILESLAAKGYGSDAAMQRIVNDSMNNYSRSVTRVMMDDAPQGTQYVYVGPADEKTRPFCLEAAAAGRMTLEAIQALGGEWGASLTGGGGINCRHQWEIASSEVRDQFHRGAEAEDLLDAQ